MSERAFRNLTPSCWSSVNKDTDTHKPWVFHRTLQSFTPTGFRNTTDILPNQKQQRAHPIAIEMAAHIHVWLLNYQSPTIKKNHHHDSSSVLHETATTASPWWLLCQAYLCDNVTYLLQSALSALTPVGLGQIQHCAGNTYICQASDKARSLTYPKMLVLKK